MNKIFTVYDQPKVMNKKQYIDYLYGKPKFRRASRFSLMEYLKFQDRGYPTPFGPICFGTNEI